MEKFKFSLYKGIFHINIYNIYIVYEEIYQSYMQISDDFQLDFLSEMMEKG